MDLAGASSGVEYGAGAGGKAFLVQRVGGDGSVPTRWSLRAIVPRGIPLEQLYKKTTSPISIGQDKSCEEQVEVGDNIKAVLKDLETRWRRQVTEGIPSLMPHHPPGG